MTLFLNLLVKYLADPGEARGALQTPLSLLNSLIHRVGDGAFSHKRDYVRNSGFQTVLLSTRGTTIFKNLNPGGSELLRMTSKTMEKDTKESMVANMAAMDRVNEEMKDQVEKVAGVGQVTICHRLVNCLHDGKERLAAVESKVQSYLVQGIVKKTCRLRQAGQDLHRHLHGLPHAAHHLQQGRVSDCSFSHV